jgi:phosphatidate cytidylyltransferase
MSNIAKRIISASLLAPALIFLILNGGLLFFGLVFLSFFIMLYEWSVITRFAKRKFLWMLFGFVYIGFACFVIVGLERIRFDFLGISSVPTILLILIFLVWINDIFSYIFGRAIGGKKLAPKISPNKTWAGAIGGIIGCLLFFVIMNLVIDKNAFNNIKLSFYIALAIHFFIPIVSQIGDLFESWLKRKSGLKDSGNIIPGHGGLLDRLDGLLLVMNVTGIAFIVLYKMASV